MGFVSPSRPVALRHWLSAIGYLPRLLLPHSHGLIRRALSPAFGAGKALPAPANVVSRSLSTIRTGIFRCCSQKLVSAAAKVPVSNSLFAGAPPPQTSKYSQVSSQRFTPAKISEAIWLYFGFCNAPRKESVLTLPISSDP